MTRTLTNLALKSLFGVITGMTLFAHQAISAPIAGPKGILVVPLDNSQVVQVRAARAYRGGSVHRGAAVHRRATVYRGGAVVRRGRLRLAAGTMEAPAIPTTKIAEAAVTVAEFIVAALSLGAEPS
jgi:hypothetical protein